MLRSQRVTFFYGKCKSIVKVTPKVLNNILLISEKNKHRVEEANRDII
jgi:hypothetical protein